MDLYLFHSDRYQQLYNCSYDVNQVPFEDRQHIALGTMFITLAGIMELLYIPCTFAIWKHRENGCYKIMFYIAVTDMMAMLMNGIATGWLAIIGAVFCTHPNLTYILGAYGMSLWGAESTAELILALNRCMEICSPAMADILFSGYRTWLWLMLPSIYGLYWFFFTMPHPFSGIYVSWFFNPHMGYLEDLDKIYYNNVHDFHNYVVVTVIMGTYLAFSILLIMKTYKFKSSTQQSYSQKMTFIQVVLISSINAFAAGIYVYMQYFKISKALIVIGQLSWLFAHGIPSLIYLCLNKTIRKDCLKMTTGVISQITGKSIMQTSTTRMLNTTNVRTIGGGRINMATASRHGGLSRVVPTNSTMNTMPTNNVKCQKNEGQEKI
ncbi:hypothetical protein niasHT_014173 [Heterodera trifolii]|uniref:Serpentine Receptor, class T n=1 Tax=Heterodera trifolii TaxID=157864 RepID=A0ABD2KX83_9BILA